MPLIGAEAAAASAVAGLASAIVLAYLADRLGFALAPFALLPLAGAAAAVVWLRLRRRASGDRAASIAAALLAIGTFAWLVWRARPDGLPTGSGSDLAHHLALLAYIERHRRLVHDAAVGAYLGEMIDYTPGAHLLTAILAPWLRRDGLHVIHPLIAITVALKSALVFLIARRLMADGVPRLAFAVVAVLLLWLPYTFFVGSFMEQSFLAQVVSELFAVAMWWTVVMWNEWPVADWTLLFALFGAAAFLTWPVWIGPLVLTLAAVVFARRDLAGATRARHVAIALGPIAIVAAVYAASRQVYGFGMVNAVGFALWPSPRTLTWAFIVLAAVGIVHAIVQRRARSAALLFAAIVLQGAALIVTGRSGGAQAPYLALKMSYLAIYPLAVAAAAFLGRAWRDAPHPTELSRYAWAPVAILAIAIAVRVARAPRPTPVITEPVVLAGEWARTHVPPSCVDYLVADGYTGYWLHLAVLGNPRAAGRALDNDTFEPARAVVRWILPGGLPYAIADHFEALPRDIRTNVDVLARFGPAAVVKRRGASHCD